MSYLSADQASAKYQVNPSTPPNWAAKGYIHTFRDQHGVIRYNSEEIEAGFAAFGPSKMRDGRTRGGQKVIPIVVVDAAEGGELR